MRPSKPILHGLATLAILIAGVLCSATPALALETNFKEEIGKGLFPRGAPLVGLAVSNSTGDIYVANGTTRSVDRFEQSGHLVEALPGLQGEEFLAVDNSASPSAGDLYVAERATNFVVLSSPSGVAVNFAGVAPYISGADLTGTPTGPSGEVVPFSNIRGITVDTLGQLYITANGVVDIFSSEGIYERQLAPPSGDPSAVAVAADGTVYVVDAGIIDVFNAKGAAQPPITGPSSGSFTSPAGVAVDNSTSPADPAAGDVYVSDAAFEEKSAVDVFNANGEPQSQLTITSTPEGAFAYLAAVTVDGAGDIYVADQNKGLVDVFTPAPVTLPDVTTGAAVSIGHTTARITGVVDPDGLDATCVVEYNGTSVPCEPADVGAGVSEVSVEAHLTALSPRSTSYSYRVCAINVNNIPNCGKTKSFTTLPDQPVIAGESATFVTPTEALLGGAVNPETGVTTYHFAYGPSAVYGLRLPVGDLTLGSTSEQLAVQGFSLTGLQPATTYHYAIVATNAAGTTYGPDETFTTPAGPVPSVATGGALGISQGAATVSGEVDPAGVQTMYEFDLGTDTAYGTRVFGNAEAGSETRGFTAVFGSLTPGTTYHYRLVATNQYGTTYGVDRTFTTPGITTSVLTAPGTLPLVTTPNIEFPAQPGATTTTKKALTNAQKLAAALKACRGQEFGFERRKACEKQERKRYAPKKKKAKKATGAAGRASGKGGK